MPDLREDPSHTDSPAPIEPGRLAVPGQGDEGPSARRRSSVLSLANSVLRFPQFSNAEAAEEAAQDPDQYHPEMIDVLDTLGRLSASTRQPLC